MICTRQVDNELYTELESDYQKLQEAAVEYFRWLDAQKRWPNSGFEKSKDKAEKKLRKLIK